MTDHFQLLRSLEALLFAASEPQTPAMLAKSLPEGADLPVLLEELAGLYGNRGVILMRVGTAYAFRTAPDLAHLFAREQTVQKKLTRAAVEALAIVAYHQPATRAEIEEIRGVALSKGTLDALLEAGWIQPRGRREAPGRPVTWGTTQAFLDHFGLEDLRSLPGLEELKAAGLLDARPAVTALSERGALGPLPGEESDSADGEEPLSEAFGEDLLPEEDKPDEDGPDEDGPGEDEPGEDAPEGEAREPAEDDAGDERPAKQG